MTGTENAHEDLPGRLRVAAREVADARDAYRLAVELRNALVVAAIDEGFTQQAVSRAAGIDRKTITEIVARADAE